MKYYEKLFLLCSFAVILYLFGCGDKFPHRNRQLGGVYSVKITSAPTTLMVAGTVRFFAEVTDQNGKRVNSKLTWSTGDKSIADISAENGIITARTTGFTKVYVSAKGIKSSPVPVTVVNPLSSIKLVPPVVNVEAGDQQTFIAVPVDANGLVLTGGNLQWNISDPSIGNISSNGSSAVITGTGTGSATVTVTDGTTTDTAVIVVVPPDVQDTAAASVTIFPSNAGGGFSVTACRTFPFTALAYNSGGEQITGASFTWSSSDNNVASINSEGVLTAYSAGTAVITAAAENGMQGNLTVTVTNNTAFIEIFPEEVTAYTGSVEQLFAIAMDINGIVQSGISFSWSSSNQDVARVIDSNGYVLGIAMGAAEIRASCAATISSPVTVTVRAGETWLETTGMPGGLYDHSASVMNNRLYVIGGVGGGINNGGFQEGAYVSNINNDGTISEWSSLPDYPKEIRGHTSEAFGNNIFVLGGIESGIPEQSQTTIFSTYTANISNTGTGWTADLEMPDGLFSHASFITNNAVFITGGWDGQQNRQDVIFSRISNGSIVNWRFEPANQLPVGLGKHAIANTDNFVYLIGGNSGGQGDPVTPHNTVYMAEIDDEGGIGGWTETEPLPVSLIDHAAVEAGNYIFVSGGHPYGDEEISMSNVYYAEVQADGTLSVWNEATPMPAGVDSHAMVTNNGYIYIIGGKDSPSPEKENRKKTVYYTHYLTLISN